MVLALMILRVIVMELTYFLLRWVYARESTFPQSLSNSYYALLQRFEASHPAGVSQ